MNADDPRHGTTAGYNQGCHQHCCRTAAADYERNRLARRYINRGGLLVPGIGTRRRIQALMVLGWSSHTLDVELGQCRSYVTRLLASDGDVNAATAKKIRVLYERMSMTLPPTTTRYDRQRASRVRNYAAQQGWAPPLAWSCIDDPNETPAGRYEPATRAELLQEYVDRGDNLTMVCRNLGITPNSLNAWCIRTNHAHIYRALAAREGDWNSRGRIGREGAA